MSRPWRDKYPLSSLRGDGDDERFEAFAVWPDLAHCGVVGLPGGWLLLGLWGLRGLGCALTWGYESVRSHGQDGVGGPCGADRALLPERGAQHRAHWLGP